MKKPKISAEVSQDEFDAYKAAAAERGVSLSEWLRLSLNRSIESDRATEGPRNAMASEEAFTLMPPPTPKPPPPPLETSFAMTQNPDQHPCVYLNPQRPGVLSSGECSGTCTAPSQRGKPCFFGPVGARNCPAFASRVAPAPPVLNATVRR